jgi:phosphoribosylglycinamide formyltransferase-1
LQHIQPDLIILAGFMEDSALMVKDFPNKILIFILHYPQICGKGMPYGSHVHEAVVANSETESSITHSPSVKIKDSGCDH